MILGHGVCKTKTREREKGRRAAYLNLKFAHRYQAGLPNVTARPHGAWECGWELPEDGLCGSSYFLGATHLVCLGVRIDPNCFAASHMRLEVEWKEISNTQLVGGRGVRRGQHSKANYCMNIFAWDAILKTFSAKKTY